MTSPAPAPVRVAVIGAGFIARWFMEAAALTPGVQVVAVVSARPAHAAAFAAEHGIGASYATVPQLLAACGPTGPTPADLVYVGSPNVLHADQAVAALEAGFHVLVEKPFALRPDQARAMVAAARAADRFLMEGWVPAFEPGVAALREVLASGELGRVHRALLVKEQFSSRMEAYRGGALPAALDPAAGGGSLMDLGVYPVGLAVHLFGSPTRVTASAQLLGSGADSHGTVVLDYDDGAWAGLQVTCLHSKTSPAVVPSVLTGDATALIVDDCQWPRRLTTLSPARAVPAPPADPGTGVASTGAGDVIGAGTRVRQVERRGPVLAYELAEVVRALGAGERESALRPLADSVRTVEILTEARHQCGIVLTGDRGTPGPSRA
ncbi:Gfo/Idh/MocA family oxidoreductase [uncultured Actinomyces sp.]|uniref:Gfo/Idh/MocA family protein n=1 Tax=uncultured Actinomyces sp. TaxID=249061 RepID=UPI0028DC4385|nr:Gfo/Idh/MocA family oxidoreductase [uncultured Actinomyces sp.]